LTARLFSHYLVFGTHTWRVGLYDLPHETQPESRDTARSQSTAYRTLHLLSDYGTAPSPLKSGDAGRPPSPAKYDELHARREGRSG
jgi:hypothetical protein